MWPDTDTPSASTPPGTRAYAIGDVHGRLDLLDRLHLAIEEDAATAPESRKVLVHLGDYVDRGPDSAGVLDRLLEGALPGFEWIVLKGNHEDLMLRFLDDPGSGPLWMMNGGAETLRSYGFDVDRRDPGLDFRDLRDRFAAALPAAHRDFLRSLSLTHREGDYLFVHAGIRPGVPLEQQVEEDLIWIRDEFLHCGQDHGYVVVHGHTPVAAPEVRFNRIGIDTGAVWSGVLTALAMAGGERRFLAA